MSFGRVDDTRMEDVPPSDKIMTSRSVLVLSIGEDGWAPGCKFTLIVLKSCPDTLSNRERGRPV